MYRKNIYLALMLIISMSFMPLPGQIISTDIEYITYELRQNAFKFEDDSKPYSDIKGDAYLFEAFIPGTIYMNKSSVPANLRFNRYTEQVEILYKDYLYELSGAFVVDSIVMDGQRFIYSLLLDKNGEVEPGSFFIELNSGNYVLLQRMNVRLKEGEPVQLYKEAKPAEFIEERFPFYIKEGDNAAIHVSSVKDLQKNFGGKSKEADLFLKENSVSPRDKADLLKFTALLNSGS